MLKGDDGPINPKGCLLCNIILLQQWDKSSRTKVFCKKGVLRNFAKFTENHLCHSLFFATSACNFIKKETLAQVFSCEFHEISKNTFCYRTPPVPAYIFNNGIMTIHQISFKYIDTSKISSYPNLVSVTLVDMT